jgi:hypothetical protein
MNSRRLIVSPEPPRQPLPITARKCDQRNGGRGQFAPQQRRAARVSDGSKSGKAQVEHMLSALTPKADIDRRLGNVRLCPLSARKRHMQCSKLHLQSITSSASASSCTGTVSPSALAALRLMTSSNFVGCSTGISAGFWPFRILSTSSAARR